MTSAEHRDAPSLPCGDREQERDASAEILLSVGLFLILVLALVLRLYRLSGQSLWYDEGTSVALAQRDVSTIIQSAAADIHPPLYYLVLSAWVRFFGTGEIAVRLLSVGVGVAVVCVVYLLGRRLFGQTVALVAAFLAALSPFLVYYSQETRMYIQTTLLSALSVYVLVLALSPSPRGGRGKRLLWPVYVLITAAALYSHYFAATVVLAEDVAIALVLLWALIAGHSRQRPPATILVPLLVAQAIVAVVYAPWLPVMAAQLQNWPAISQFYSLPALIGHLLPIFSLGLSAEAVNGVVVFVFAGVLLLGIAPSLPIPRSLPTWQEEAFGYILIVSWLVVPVLSMFVLSLRRPLYNPKFLLVAMPAFCLLLARGLVVLANVPRIGRILMPAALVILTVASLISLRAYYTDQRYARDDYRGIAQTISAASRSGDAIILNAPGQSDIFTYYYRGRLPLYPLPRQRPPDRQATLDELNTILATHDRIWVVYYGDQQADPQRIMESWLDRQSFKASDRWFGNVRLALYARAATAGRAMQPLNVRFDDAIQLDGYSIAAAETAAGDIVPLTLYWRTAKPLNERFTVFVHVVDSYGVLWGQRDSEPGSGLRPTTTWQTGETIQDNYGLPVLTGTPPGEYQIEIGLYRAENGQRLPITDGDGKALGDHLLIGSLVVVRPTVPPSPDALGMPHRLMATVGPLRLLGYGLGKLGREPGATEFTDSDVLHLVLFWQAGAQPPGDLSVDVKVIDSRGQIAIEYNMPPVHGDYPTSAWTAHEVVRDQYHIPLAGLKAGRYRLAIDLRDATGRRVGEIGLGEFIVRATPSDS